MNDIVVFSHRFLNSYHYQVMVAPKFSSVNTMFEDSQNPYMNQFNPERPPDTAVNIQHGCTFQRNSFNLPRSPLYLPMDSSPPSEVDYAKRVVTASNRMNIKPSIQSIAHTSDSQAYTNNNKVVPNASCQNDPSTMPIPPLAIPYKANALADPNLWNGHFGPVSLFSTNEFLLNNTRNISCSLIRIAEFIKQKCITNQDSNKIHQLNTFESSFHLYIGHLQSWLGQAQHDQQNKYWM